ncbi:MAG: 30S ribosomal protein S18 [Thermodesulfobacteriota bacterium]|nr:30S ribosomal protein S18 [Thermodesulfobacteriota bacterium]
MAEKRRFNSNAKPRSRFRSYYKKKVCKFCEDKDLKIDYKEAGILKEFITERGKILPRRITGVCSRHQRRLSIAIKKARILALLPFTVHE